MSEEQVVSGNIPLGAGGKEQRRRNWLGSIALPAAVSAFLPSMMPQVFWLLRYQVGLIPAVVRSWRTRIIEGGKSVLYGAAGGRGDTKEP